MEAKIDTCWSNFVKLKCDPCICSKCDWDRKQYYFFALTLFSFPSQYILLHGLSRVDLNCNCNSCCFIIQSIIKKKIFSARWNLSKLQEFWPFTVSKPELLELYWTKEITRVKYVIAIYMFYTTLLTKIFLPN